MGHVIFTLAQLKEKGKVGYFFHLLMSNVSTTLKDLYELIPFFFALLKNPSDKEWYKLKKVKTGEIQLAFTYIPPQV